jgi:hypothetical protein
MAESSEPKSTSNRAGRHRFGIRMLLTLPILVGLAIFTADSLMARFVSARRSVGVQIVAVDHDTGKPVANGTLMLIRDDRDHSTTYMGDAANFSFYGFEIYSQPTSWLRGSSRTDYRGWSVKIRAGGYREWGSSLSDLTADESKYQNTSHPPAIIVRLKKAEPAGEGGEGMGDVR